jgi:hypothetical protein
MCRFGEPVGVRYPGFRPGPVALHLSIRIVVVDRDTWYDIQLSADENEYVREKLQYFLLLAIPFSARPAPANSGIPFRCTAQK